jgi:hypothetical protein
VSPVAAEVLVDADTPSSEWYKDLIVIEVDVGLYWIG